MMYMDSINISNIEAVLMCVVYNSNKHARKMF